jgi:hypothetical protein
MSRRHSPPLRNPLNQPALDQLIHAYDEARRLGNDRHRHAFSNAINALRATAEHVNTIDVARNIRSVGGGAMGYFIVDANNGREASL